MISIYNIHNDDVYIFNIYIIYTYVSPLAKQAVEKIHPAGGNEEGDAIDGEELSQQLTEDCDDVERLDGQYMHMDCEWIMYRW